MRSTMWSFGVSSLLFATQISAAALVSRATDLTCTDLRVASNDGNRKIAIVIDSSGSMSYSDPYDLRLTAGRALNDFLINSKDAAGKTPDLVTVIDFDDVATLDYPLGDPGDAANSSFSKIDSYGGTFIAEGVQMAVDELTKAGSGDTAGRSGIVVFTDGEDYDTDLLVEAINNATGLGIRVNFGFLDSYSSYQDKGVLLAIDKSGGIYATITTEDSSQGFINYAILNGLTQNDNPSGDKSTLLAGLATAHFTNGGTETQSITYSARKGEQIDFTVESVDAGELTAELTFGGKSQDKTTVDIYSPGYLTYSAHSAGQIEIKVTSTDAPKDSIFVVGATSNMPAQNCTVGVGKAPKGGMTVGAKVGLGVGIPVGVALLGLLGFMLYKYWSKFKLPKLKLGIPDLQAGHHGVQATSWDPQPTNGPMSGPTNGPTNGYPNGPTNGYPNGGEKFLHTVPPTDPSKPGLDDTAHSIHSGISAISNTAPVSAAPPPPPTNPEDKKHRVRINRRNADDKYHHHHLPDGHPCIAPTCPQVQPNHQHTDYRCLCADPANPAENHPCENIKIPCPCTDQECPLNDPGHKCPDPLNPCACLDPECPLSKEQAEKRRNDRAFGFGTKLASIGANQILHNM